LSLASEFGFLEGGVVPVHGNLDLKFGVN
jgi:hypothetical protein